MLIGNASVLAVIVGVVGVAVVWFYFRRADAIRMARFIDREDKGLHDLYTEYFRESGITETNFENLWLELSKTLEIPAGKLRPNDRFDVELSPAKGYEFNDPIREAKYLIGKYCNNTGAAYELIKTVRDYIEVFGSTRKTSP